VTTDVVKATFSSVGGTLVLAPEEVRTAGRELTEFLARERVTHLILPPSLVSALPDDCELPAGATILVGTETVPPELIRRWAGRLNMLAAYGLTEATWSRPVRVMFDTTPCWSTSAKRGTWRREETNRALPRPPRPPCATS